MATIIDKTYFEGGELNIPGTETNPVSGKVLDFINKYEPLYLQKALGYPLWKLFKADNYPTSATPRFEALLNGNVEYTDRNGHVHLWTGFNTKIESPIAMYIWYWYQRNNVSFNSSQGEVKGKTENSTNVSVSLKQMRAWNEMDDITCQLWEFLKYAKTDGAATYPEFDIHQVCRFGKTNMLNI